MARFNAASELARFWIEVRHGFLVTESVPVAVPYGLSDIDILAMHPSGGTITLPKGHAVGPRLIIEAKDEHDFDPKGREFGKALRRDLEFMADDAYVRSTVKAQVTFSMFREAHCFVKLTFALRMIVLVRLTSIGSLSSMPSILRRSSIWLRSWRSVASGG